MMSPKKIESIQALRGIAALMVLFSHYMFFVTDPAQAAVARFLFLSGGAGVDLFFVIAGFVLVTSTQEANGTLSYAATFAARRLLRIWPAYIAATVLFLLTIRGTPWLADVSNLVQSLRSLLFLPLSPADSPFFGYAVLEVGWTLNYEIYFYAVAALTMLCGRRRWAALFAWIAISVIVVPAAMGVFSLNVKTPYGLPSYLGLMTNSIILDFAAGVLIGLLYQSRLPVPPKRLVYLTVAVGFTLLSVQFFGRVQAGHGIARYGFSCAVIMLGLAWADKGRFRIPVPSSLVWLGGVSYSLYLTHTTVNQVLHTGAHSIGLGAATTGFGMLCLSTLVSIAFAYAFSRVFEIRLTRPLDRRLRSAQHGATIAASRRADLGGQFRPIDQ